MKKLFILSLIIVAVVLNLGSQQSEKPTREIFNKMLQSIAAHKGSTFTMRSYERFKGKKEMIVNEMQMRQQVNPLKTYSKVTGVHNTGTELLYVKGERDGKILVNPGAALPNLKFSPFSSMLTKDQHHTLLSAGFGIVNKLVTQGIKRADERGEFDKVFRYEGDVVWNKRPCYKVIIDDPTWAITTTTAQKGDNIYTVALRLLVPEYSLVELNDGIKNFETDLTGRTLKVPTSYAKKTVFYIDKETYFPIVQEMYDDKGMFEKYEYYSLVVNPRFSEDEFTEDCKLYNF